jgi:glutamine amidotransferase
MRAAILDYGAGNLYSLARALRANGAEVTITSSVNDALTANALILPGVGAFGKAAEFLAPNRDTIALALADGLPCLAICLGAQLLFDSSEEGEGRGLGVIAGRVRRINADRLPQIGWNEVEDVSEPLISANGLTTVFYANSYVCEPFDSSVVTSWSTHESDRFPASVRRGRTVGVQFHPEKSSFEGVAMIGAFLSEARR